MPNWCYNSATIKHHDKEMIDVIDNCLKEDGELFNQIRPNPTGEWQYEWSIQNWGTKWDAQIGGFERIDDNTIHINFDTAWSPCTGLYEYMVEEQGYDVDAYYTEEGMAFAGRFSDGCDDYYEYSGLSADEVQDLLGDIDEHFGISERMRDDERMQAEDDWENSLVDLERTDWYPNKIKPVTAGVYEVETDSWPYPNKIYWTGEEWQFYAFEDNCGNGFPYPNKVKQWRGVTEESYLESMLNDFQKSLDELVDNE